MSNKQPLTAAEQKKKKRKQTIILLIVLLILIGLFIYFYTYIFAKDERKIIYEQGQRRIYLLDKKEYKKGREMWRMVLEDQKTGTRYFILGNSRKGFDNKKMSDLIINTVDQGKQKSFDQVQGAGITMRLAKTDVHANMIEKSKLSEITKNFEGLNIDL